MIAENTDMKILTEEHVQVVCVQDWARNRGGNSVIGKAGEVERQC
jgi:hypothetical protein